PLVGSGGRGACALRVVRQSGGLAGPVPEDGIRVAMAELADRQGLLAEPTGACSLAAAQALLASGRIPMDAVIVCMVTGHGYKDMKIYRGMPTRVRQLPSEPDDAQLSDLLRA